LKLMFMKLTILHIDTEIQEKPQQGLFPALCGIKTDTLAT